MQKAFDEVLIFCPEVKTGGPEALHQLGYQIGRHGGSARMVYYGPYSTLAIGANTLRCDSRASPMPAHFAQYCPNVLAELQLPPNTLFVFPEPLAKLASQRGDYRRALWWLSVDNAFTGDAHLADPAARATFFADAELMHFYQSDYACTFLKGCRAQQYYPLSDYTDPQFLYRSRLAATFIPIEARGRRVCYFPRKGGELATRFLDSPARQGWSADFIALRDMSKAEVSDALFACAVYLDFGHHPGKDRVPREAAVAGSVVLVHAAGAASGFSDYPLLPEYRFTEADIASGDLHRRLRAILDDPRPHWQAQRPFRQRILLEEEQFALEVRSLFFTGA